MRARIVIGAVLAALAAGGWYLYRAFGPRFGLAVMPELYVTFLVALKNAIEDPTRLLIDL